MPGELNTRRFTRVQEDFTCTRCGTAVQGDGYTDHCPHCLWSLHVDIHPGDRLSTCRGLMKPIGVESGRKEWIIHYCCQRCGYKRRNRTATSDEFDAVLRLAGDAGG
ncbi:MAG TPA: RNHCP domain-containing protein [Bryobacteraceae bacterium]|nr:RNHCP domain-containing protein [Bryobacteraceae bacterium]